MNTISHLFISFDIYKLQCFILIVTKVTNKKELAYK